jgi:hypothetical protein
VRFKITIRRIEGAGWTFFKISICLLALGSLVNGLSAPGQSKSSDIIDFTDIAEKVGLTAPNVFGGKQSSTYILESTGTGVAIFDYDNDGWPDIFLVNGTTLGGFPAKDAPSNHLYHNNHDGTFTDVTTKAGLTATGWGQGVCVGDYDNEGWDEVFWQQPFVP